MDSNASLSNLTFMATTESLPEMTSMDQNFTNTSTITPVISTMMPMSLEERFNVLSQNADVFFLIVNAIIIYFMQCGFAILECGAVRSKNATNILIKNMLDSLIGALCYWLFGYALAFGGGNPFCGDSHFAASGVEAQNIAKVFFQYTFAVTSSTIVSGAVAERCNFNAYIIYSVIFTGFMYPIVSHWAWAPEGWLAQGIAFGDTTVSYQDFAGSGVVHLVGGTAGFWGALLLGPRIGRFESLHEYSEEIRGHSVPMAALGGFILFLGFFAFNGGSQGSISQPGDAESVAIAVLNTIISGASAAVVTVLSKMMSGYLHANRDGSVRKGKWSLLITINGGLSGMVAICAGANVMDPWAACVTGLVAGIVYIAIAWLMQMSRVDDPLDAVAVHLGSGTWGVIAVCLFHKTKGAFIKPDIYAGYMLAVNVAGAVAIFAWTTLVSCTIFGILKAIGMLRVSSEVELQGLDIAEHDEAAYPVSAYKNPELQDYLKEMFNDASDPSKAIRGRKKLNTIAGIMASGKLALVNGSLMVNRQTPKEPEKKYVFAMDKDEKIDVATNKKEPITMF